MSRQRKRSCFILALSIFVWWLSSVPLRGWAPDSLFVGDPATRAIFAVVNGRKRLVPDAATLEAMGLSLADVRWLTAYVLDRLPSGPNLLPLRAGDLIKRENARGLYLLDGGKRAISEETLLAFGWGARSVRSVPGVLVAAMPDAGAMPDLGIGDLVRSQETDCLFLLARGKHWLVDEAILAAGGWWADDAHLLSPAIMSLIPDGDVLPTLLPGCLLGSLVEGDGRVYLLDGGKHLIPDEATFAAYGWDESRVLRLSPPVLAAIPEKTPLAPAIRGENLFYEANWGQCTWYVAERRIAPSWRSAKYWYRDAQIKGYAVGQYPMPGAVIVYDGGSGRGIYGHVAYVEAVYPDGSFARADSNICGWECVRTRVTDLGSEVGVLGFVYWRYQAP